MTNAFRAAVLLATLLSASLAGAQNDSIVSLAPEHLPRWDVAGHADWFGGNKSDVTLDGGNWYGAASLGASAGYYWTPHVKVEADVSATTEGKVFIYQQVPTQGLFSRYGTQHVRSTSASGGLTYQFLENRWFHPFIGGGGEVVRETARTELREQMPCTRTPCPLPVLLPTETTTSYHAHPFVATGFKAYMSPRAFFRSDVRVSLSTRAAEAVSWRAGFGVDF
jgi:hypothetical protein